MTDLSGDSIRSIPSSYRPVPDEGSLIASASMQNTHDWGRLDASGAVEHVTIIDYASDIGADDEPKTLAMKVLRLLRKFAN